MNINWEGIALNMFIAFKDLNIICCHKSLNTLNINWAGKALNIFIMFKDLYIFWVCTWCPGKVFLNNYVTVFGWHMSQIFLLFRVHVYRNKKICKVLNVWTIKYESVRGKFIHLRTWFTSRYFKNQDTSRIKILQEIRF